VLLEYFNNICYPDFLGIMTFYQKCCICSLKKSRDNKKVMATPKLFYAQKQNRSVKNGEQNPHQAERLSLL